MKYLSKNSKLRLCAYNAISNHGQPFSKFSNYTFWRKKYDADWHLHAAASELEPSLIPALILLE